MKNSARIPLPSSPKKLIELAESILKRHNDLGADSPLGNLVDVDGLTSLLATCKDAHTDSVELRQQAKAATQRRNRALGIAPDQSITTSGTLLNSLAVIREMMKGLYKGNEQELSTFGYDVAISKQGVSSSEETDSSGSSEMPSE